MGLKHGFDVPGGLNSGQQVRFIPDRAALPYAALYFVGVRRRAGKIKSGSNGCRAVKGKYFESGS
jgi:hypothetical protein